MRSGGCRVTFDRRFQRDILPYGARVLVGVSGGADSTLLLHILFDLRHELALDLVVAHYDHALRRGSPRDRSFVRAMAQGLGLRFVSERNRSKCPAGTSLEDFARQKRLDFFVRQADALKAAAVVLAHTRDDLAETVLMRILRGTGLSGLRSILPEKTLHGVTFLRPMLAMSRRDVERSMRRRRLDHIEDPTNASNDLLRNRIRHRLIPYIARGFAPAVKEKLTELALNAAVDHAFLEDELHKILPRVSSVRCGIPRIAVRPWRKLPQALRRMALREAFKAKGLPAPSFDRIVAIERAGLDATKRSIVISPAVKVVFSDKFITLS